MAALGVGTEDMTTLRLSQVLKGVPEVLVPAKIEPWCWRFGAQATEYNRYHQVMSITGLPWDSTEVELDGTKVLDAQTGQLICVLGGEDEQA